MTQSDISISARQRHEAIHRREEHNTKRKIEASSTPSPWPLFYHGDVYLRKNGDMRRPAKKPLIGVHSKRGERVGFAPPSENGRAGRTDKATPLSGFVHCTSSPDRRHQRFYARLAFLFFFFIDFFVYLDRSRQAKDASATHSYNSFVS